MLRSTYAIPDLPPPGELESKAVLKVAAIAHRFLAELKGRAATIPNQGILIDTLSLQEAKASSEIENIVTTQDELFQATLFPENPASPAAKEVALYRDALHLGLAEMREKQGILTNNMIVAMFQILKRTDGGFRNTPGTALKNDRTGEVVYIPPQTGAEVIAHMTALEKFINGDEYKHLDALVRMAIIHHQFESIHPFPDGNGRLGRIINVLYLTQQRLLDIPILYLSRYITANKADYYRLLQSVRDTGEWEPWLIYMLTAVAETAAQTIDLVADIRTLMADYKQRIRSEHGKIYSQDLLNNLFRHPYTRIDYVVSELGVSRQTAAKYLDQLAEADLLVKHQSGRNVYFINTPLVALLQRGEDEVPAA
ncbi:MAG TPA: Fic family protein [Sphingopyxis sp.]|jgi:Fic family protein|uniref:Fic family protein n=1 Tax=Sphingopyxis sp. TaxID=1908224 RepID=UPI002E11FB55|nr:Fic family protein [Sphingopyxis sp.]